jgi:hypothetical protein
MQFHHSDYGVIFLFILLKFADYIYKNTVYQCYMADLSFPFISWKWIKNTAINWQIKIFYN